MGVEGLRQDAENLRDIPRSLGHTVIVQDLESGKFRIVNNTLFPIGVNVNENPSAIRIIKQTDQVGHQE